MRRTIAVSVVLLLTGLMALAQAGTNNNSTSQQEVKPGTGRGGEILLSPDINQQITGNVGYTGGATPDVSAFSNPATAGAISGGAESTATVTTAEQLTRQFVEDQVARESGSPSTNGAPPPNAFNQGATPQTDQNAKAQDAQHPGPEPQAHNSDRQREKTKAGQKSTLPQGDEAAQDQTSSRQASQEPNYKSDHNSVTNRKDYSGKSAKRHNKKATPIEGGFHKPGAPVQSPSQGQPPPMR